MNLVRRELRTLRAAVAYFTRLPVASVAPEDLAGAPRYFPLVGWLVGATGAATWWLATLVLPGDIAVVIALAATILLTGALHEDGFADVCDGFGGGYDRAKILEIMKDSRVGAFGAIGVALLLGLKVITLMHVPAVFMVGTLMAGHAASRWTAGTLLFTHDYVRVEAEAKAKPMARRMAPSQLVLPAVLGIAPVFALLPLRCSLALAGPIVVGFAMGRWFRARIGGYTGDCIGATQQVGEVAFYLVVVGLTWR